MTFEDYADRVNVNFPPRLDHISQEIFGCSGPFDQSGTFDPIAILNKQFPDSNSLSNLESYKSHLNNELKKTEDSIYKSVRLHSRASAESRTDLASAKGAVNELADRVNSIRLRSEETEKAVKHVSKDVMLLDVAKKNITTTIITMKRLVMLVNACEQLTQLASEREYSKTSGLVDAVKELQSYFDPFKGVPRIDELLRHSIRIFGDLRLQIIEDFNQRLNESNEVPAQSSSRQPSSFLGAFETSEAIGSSLKGDLIESFLSALFRDYQDKFQTSQVSEFDSLDSTDRRFQWLSKCLRDHSERKAYSFPEHWFIPALICQRFCNSTRHHFTLILKTSSSKQPKQIRNPFDPSMIVQIMTKCLELELDMQRRFDKLYREVKARYLAKHPEITEEQQRFFDCYTFKGSMSDCFAYLVPTWLKSEESNIADFINSVRQTGNIADEVIGLNNPSDYISGSPRKEASFKEPRLVFGSSVELFSKLKSLLSKCRAFSTGKELKDCADICSNSLRLYIRDVLRMRFPSPQNLGEDSLEVICTVIGSCHYIESTTSSLQDSVKEALDDKLKESVSFQEEVKIAAVVSKEGLSFAVACALSSEVAEGFSNMGSLDWKNFDAGSVTGVSPVIPRITRYLSRCVRVLASSLTTTDYEEVLGMIAIKLVNDSNECIDTLRPIGEAGAQQLLVDFSSLRTSIAEIPSHAGNLLTQTGIFTKAVNSGFRKIENLLKALASSNATDSIAVVEMLKSLDPTLSAFELESLVSRVRFLISDTSDEVTAASLTYRPPQLSQSSKARPHVPTMVELTDLFNSKSAPQLDVKTAASRTFKTFSDSLKASSKKFFATRKETHLQPPPPSQ